MTISTGRWWFFGQTADQVTALINKFNARLTNIRIENPSIPTFAVSMVSNTGAYGSAWWWYFGVDATTLSGLLDGKRLISIDPYQTPAGLRFAVVMVPNTGAQGRAWWWYFGVDGVAVNNLCNQNGARLVSLRPYMSGNNLVHAVIMVSNTDVDSKGWQWLSSSSIDTISAAVNANHRRVVSLAPNPVGGWDAILIDSEGERWWWWFGLDAATVTNNLAQHATRLIDLSSYIESGVRKYAVVELDDSNLAQPPINTESIRVQSYAESNGWAGGFHGVYAVNGSAGQAPIVAYNSDFRFEPASSIKVLYLLYTLKQGVKLDDPITYYWTDGGVPDGSVCPLIVPETLANARTTTIQNALNGMIKDSNNVYTRAFEIRWGPGAVQAMAAGLGLSRTFLGQAYIGCGFIGGVRNELTLSDITKIYRGVDDGTILSGVARQTFLDTLVGGPGSGGSAFNRVVSTQAGLLGKSSIVPQFLSSLDVRWKGGSYGFGLAPTGTSKIDYSIAGLAYMPFKGANGAISYTSYFFGDFVNDLVIHCPTTPPCTASDKAGSLLLDAAAEALTGPIRDALATW